MKATRLPGGEGGGREGGGGRGRGEGGGREGRGEGGGEGRGRAIKALCTDLTPLDTS